ncbi:hypothetical protein C6988_10345 [Nitrosopumilus sp. b1]|uniref:hypothetical protein n=1 Tax=Nitrosopumilus sp. b1 TaxID=2109907 RepID=UPI0015F7613F|nr:hypothetical protein [Nitrosopumilus sp. b1]KAF6242054.1 hypothetical protein C6988_10345 [Nitrosopumilus sp. b1]
MNAWNKFWKWYEDKILGSILIIAVIQFIQIPHMVWNADLYLQTGMISRIHPALDWLLYGVDLIEIVSIINVGMIMFSLIKKRRQQRREAYQQLSNKQ